MILIRVEDVREQFLKIFELDRWDAAIGHEFNELVISAQDTLYLYRQYFRRSFNESEQLLAETYEVSIGELRTGFGGMAMLPALPEIHPELLEDKENQHCSEQAFQALMKTLIEHSDPYFAVDNDDQFPTYNW